tara:strand:+ start:231 stop:533 length:303 start_codon:yes stop_codon:yes gene_type:complete
MYDVLVEEQENIVFIDDFKFTFPPPRRGDTVAFYTDEYDRSSYLFGFITIVTPSGRVHLHVYDGNGTSIRKRVDIADERRIKYRWLPLEHAHTLEDEKQG